MTDKTIVDQKERGNECFKNKNYWEAIKCYSNAINDNPNDHLIYSNRSAAYIAMKYYPEAIIDAYKCIEIMPTWFKGYLRAGIALHGWKKYDDSIE